jgi:cytochrome c-type biogenesis protein CcmH
MRNQSVGRKKLFRRIEAGCLVLLLSVVLSLQVSTLATAQGSGPTGVTDDQVNAIAKQLYCPVCENIPLDVCGTQACAQWRELIREKLGQGWTESQIKQYFVDQYGARVLGTPPAQGLNWLVYVIPPLAIIAGIVILFFVLRAFRRNAPSTVPVAPQVPPSDEYIARMEEELNKR